MAHPCLLASGAVSVLLDTSEERGEVRLKIKVLSKDSNDLMEASDTDSEADSSASSDEDVAASSSDEDVEDFSDIREMLYAADLGESEEGGLGDAAHAASRQLLGSAPIRPIEDIAVGEADALTPAGAVLSVVEGVVVVKAQAGFPPLDEGSVLVDAERRVVGVVEDVFGPVVAPMYVIRLPEVGGSQGEKDVEQDSPCVSSATPLVPGVPLFSVDRLKAVLPAHQLIETTYDPREDADSGEEEMHFSDDEKEAQYLRGLKSKKRGPAGREDAVGRGGRGRDRGRRGQSRGARGGRGRGGASAGVPYPCFAAGGPPMGGPMGGGLNPQMMMMHPQMMMMHPHMGMGPMMGAPAWGPAGPYPAPWGPGPGVLSPPPPSGGGRVFGGLKRGEPGHQAGGPSGPKQPPPPPPPAADGMQRGVYQPPRPFPPPSQ